MSNGDVDRDIGQKDDEAHGFDTEFLDDTDDTHAAAFGLWRGFRGMKPEPVYVESKQNPHYFQVFYIVGRFLQLAFVGVAGYVGAGMI
jgi:hypothetical protein